YYRIHPAVMLDGKRLNSYACSGEIEYYSKQHDGIGTFCHEFGHVLGLRDHYATDDGNHKTLGFWDTMDAGPYNNEGNTPPLFSAYEQFFLGWLTPVVISDTGSYSLNALTQEQKAYLLCAGGTHNLIGNDPNPTTFYMLENRQQDGWDAYLPGHGLLLTKIQYNFTKWDYNEVNNDASSMGYDLIEADGRATSSGNSDDKYGKATDAFPAGATSYSGISGYPINAIAEQNGVITFRIGNGGGTSGSGNCDNYSWTATRSLSAGDVILGDYTWAITAPDGAYFGYEGSSNQRGAQFGSGKKPIQNLSLTTNEVVSCLISSVTVTAAMASGGDSKLSLYINGTQVGTEQALTTTSTQYTFQNVDDLVGQLEIRIANTQKAAYIKQIEISQTGATTEIRDTEEQSETRKIIRNGELLILRDDATYDILGRRVH
ncbi:MAG: immune inhibitor A, partial [Paludibacteraceae bacterium]|nr:immune inhibitor A [Paludibacteraceae bacterium]